MVFEHGFVTALLDHKMCMCKEQINQGLGNF